MNRKEGNCTGRLQFLAAGESMQNHLLISSRLNKENLDWLWAVSRRALISASVVPTARLLVL